MAIPRNDGLDEAVLTSELQTRVRDLQHAVARGEPPLDWKAKRDELDDLWARLLDARTARIDPSRRKTA